MTRIPEEIEGLGSTNERWRQNLEFDLQSYEFDRDSYFIWSRFDGSTTVRDVILMVGLPVIQTVTIIHELRAAGAVLRPDENPKNVTARIEAARAAKRAQQEAEARADDVVRERTRAQAAAAERARAETQAADERGRRERRARADTEPSDEFVQAERAATGVSHDGEQGQEFTAEEAAALALQLDLTDKVKLRIVSMRRQLVASDYFELFGVEQEVDKRALKRTYFKLSKEFHPDRYYGRNTGPFGKWLGEIFQAVNEGFKTLSDRRAREHYISSLRGHADGQPTQSREEYAAELFERACNAETRGDISDALKLFSAVVRMDDQVRYSTRAARCATRANILDVAEEYARRARERAPDDPSVARVLADVLYRQGLLHDAEQMLVHALSVKNENDKLTSGLRRDLEVVRQEIAERGSPNRS